MIAGTSAAIKETRKNLPAKLNDLLNALFRLNLSVCIYWFNAENAHPVNMKDSAKNKTIIVREHIASGIMPCPASIDVSSDLPNQSIALLNMAIDKNIIR
jgi:hypothetical protein